MEVQAAFSGSVGEPDSINVIQQNTESVCGRTWCVRKLENTHAFYAKQTDCSLVQTAVTDGSWAGKIRPHLANLLCSLLSKSLKFPCIIRNKLYEFQTRPLEHSV